jgi:hypothetical protein
VPWALCPCVSDREKARRPGRFYGSYKEFLAERQEILCPKWIESEKTGYDIGFERGLLDWTLKYRLARQLEQPRRGGCTANFCSPSMARR